MKTLILIWKSLRPEQWIKNLFVFAGILFAQNIFNPIMLLKVIFAFLFFCIFSGLVYIFNDLVDLKSDRHHPDKSSRPLASGRLKTSHANLALITLIPIFLGLSYYLHPLFFWTGLAYFLLQVCYSFILKHMVILDVFAIACGFVLRVVAGAVVIDVKISSWLLICTILLALFLGLCKRRYELVTINEKIPVHRKVLAEYSPYLLDQMISIVAASTIVVYALYTMCEETIIRVGTRNLIFTLPFVLYGILRYLYLMHQKKGGGDPEYIIASDIPLLIDISLWVLTIGITLYT